MNAFVEMNSALSIRMATMSFLCACMIVVFYATPAPETGSWMWWFCHLFGREGVCKIAVPWFFFASGFLLASHVFEKGWWKNETKKRVKSLVIPFYIWMVITTVFGIAVWYVKAKILHGNPDVRPLDISLFGFLIRFAGFHPFEDIGPLWYVRSLFCLVCLSPLLVAISKRWRFAVAALALLHLVFTCLFAADLGLRFYFFFDRFVSVRGLLYFSVGFFMRLHGRSLFSSEGSMRWFRLSFLFAGAALLIIEGFFGVRGNRICVMLTESVLVPILAVGIFSSLPARKIPNCLTRNAFALFVMHGKFLSIAALIFSTLGVYGDARYDILVMLTRVVFAVMASLACSELLRKCFPRVAAIVFGGR